MSDHPRTVLDGFLRTVRRQPDDIAVRELDGHGLSDRPSMTWAEYADLVARAAGGLAGLGVRRGDRVVLMMRNRLEFHIADVAVLALGATPISIYNSSSPEQIAYLVQHSKASLAIVESGDFVSRVLAAAADSPSLNSVVVIGDAPLGTHPWSQLLAGEPIDLDAAAAAL